MSDTPKSEGTKFEIVDRRKLKAQQEQDAEKSAAPAAPPTLAPPQEPPAGPHLVTQEKPVRKEKDAPKPQPETREPAAHERELPPAPTAEETREQKVAYEASAERAEEILRAQNPGIGAEPPLTFDSLVQQFYVTSLIQLGIGTPEGQPHRVDVRGARSTIDVLGILADKTRGNLTPAEDRLLQSALYEARMAFLEVTGMLSMPNVPPPPQAKR